MNGPVKYAGGALGKPEFSFDNSMRTILIDANLWRELSLMGHWIRDAVILRWGEMTSRLSGNEVRVGRVLDLLLKTDDPLRADQYVRDIYAAQESLECVWTGRSLASGFDVDRAIPFALWQDSSLWNLFPASKSVNNAKRDKLPTRAVVSKREEAIVGCWKVLREKLPVRFQRESAILMGTSHKEGMDAGGHGWEEQLMNSFVEAIEYTATIRGASRWEP